VVQDLPHVVPGTAENDVLRVSDHSLEEVLSENPSDFMWPSSGSMAARRRRARLSILLSFRVPLMRTALRPGSTPCPSLYWVLALRGGLGLLHWTVIFF